MITREDFLFELLTEELPPKALLNLSTRLEELIRTDIEKSGLTFSSFHSFATPRRLAVVIKGLIAQTELQIVERKGPAKSAAFDAAGKPTKACEGFARSCGVTPAELDVKGEWVTYKQKVPGKTVAEILPPLIEQALNALPIPKRMRWGAGATQFVRPVHALVMLYGDQVVPCHILGLEANRITRGHRFMAPDWITLPHADNYQSLLKSEGYVIADFNERKEMIRKAVVEKNADISSETFLNEVTGLVEWPVVLEGSFAKEFLEIPEEVLISAMEDHQRYFPVLDDKRALSPKFVVISNIDSHDKKQVIKGNERVLRARLSDAAFFYESDKKENLEQRLERLRHVVYQVKLGTLFDKVERIVALAVHIAGFTKGSVESAKRAALLSKSDLTTDMVNEFPELQGVMGFYYAGLGKESFEVAMAIREQYLPRFAGQPTAKTPTGIILALADRIDTLAGAFGINQVPTGDKDPYGLRRAAVGIIRTLIENNINLDLKPVFEFALKHYKVKLENIAAQEQILLFIQERLRAYYLEQGVQPDVFSSVAALQIYDPLDCDQRIKAVQTFKKLAAAETLSVANKRVSNILTKYTDTIVAKKVDAKYFENAAEKELATQLEAKSQLVTSLSSAKKYDEVLIQLAELRQPIDDFFDQVMVMTDDKPKRENRLLLLSHLRALFLQVADIALLQ